LGGRVVDCRIGLAIALLDGERDQVSKRLHPDLLHDRRFGRQRIGDVLALDGGEAVFAVAVAARRHALAKIIEDRTPRCLCRLGQSLGEGVVLQIFDDQRVDAPRLDLRRSRERGSILALRQQFGVMRHEFCGTGTALQHDLPAALAPELMPHFVVARVAVAVDKIQFDVGHFNSTLGPVMLSRRR
jgi:hypothetical protein